MEQMNMQWLLDGQHRTVGLIKANLNDLEARLTSMLYRQEFDAVKLNKSVQLCLTIQKQYKELSQLLNSDNDEGLFYPPPKEQRQDLFCLQQIEILKTNLFGYTSEHALISKYKKISYYYGILAEFLECESSNHHRRQTAQVNQKPKEECLLTEFIHAQNEASCLASFMAFVKQLEKPSKTHMLTLLLGLEIEHLKLLSKKFMNKENLEFIKSIFYFKLYPDKLYEHVIHPEKLISTKIRLKQIYQFIEAMFSALKKTLALKELFVPNDNLLHGDILPAGINLHAKKTHQNRVQELVKQWHPLTITVTNRMESTTFEEIVRSYKYRFNPSRLIDILMNVQQNILKIQATETGAVNFQKHIRHFFSNLSMSQCLDLYGHFANKDTIYLMRTLYQLSKGQYVHQIPNIKEQEQEALNNIYHCLYVVMSELRLELKRREIPTNPYPFEMVCDKKLFPRKRIKNAISRAINIYKVDNQKPQNQIQALFEKLES